jgi:hypothetical protein
LKVGRISVIEANRDKTAWRKPEVRKIEAGSAEANGTGINDGGPVGNARS